MITIHSDGSIYSDVEQIKATARQAAADNCRAIRSIDLSECTLPDVDLSEEICVLEKLLEELKSTSI